MAVVSGGTTLIDNGALDSAVPTGSLILLSTQTASASASIEFSMDSTYDVYVFKYINMHPATNDVTLQINFSTDNGANYNVTKTTTFFAARHSEDDAATNLDYVTNRDLAQSTANQTINYDIGNLNDEDVCGTLTLYNPSSSIYVKHFIARSIGNGQAEDCQDSYAAGYANTTSPITNIKFTMSSGNIDDGIIKMYGVK